MAMSSRASSSGSISVSDLAVIKVNAKNLPTLPWGDSDKLRVAQWVLAIGNPFQLSGTVTLGIVSTVSRSGAQVGGYANFIQTDAAINPGNSGGALVDARGELVGINSMIYSETGGNQGIGFAIPSNLAQRIMTELIKNHGISWGSIGEITWINVDHAAAEEYNLTTTGAFVRSIARSSSAYRAGVRTRRHRRRGEWPEGHDGRRDRPARRPAESRVGPQGQHRPPGRKQAHDRRARSWRARIREAVCARRLSAAAPTRRHARGPRSASAVRPDTDPDPGRPGDGAGPDAVILDARARRHEIVRVLPQVDAHRHREVAGSATEIHVGDRDRRGRVRRRRRRMSSSPSIGSSARMRIAAGVAAASVTTFTR